MLQFLSVLIVVAACQAVDLELLFHISDIDHPFDQSLPDLHSIRFPIRYVFCILYFPEGWLKNLAEGNLPSPANLPSAGACVALVAPDLPSQ